MSFLKKITILLTITIAILLPSLVQSEQFQPSVKSEEFITPLELEIPLSPTDYADKYATQYGIDARVFKKVMWCESHNEQTKKGDKGLAYGVFQFHKPTFDSYAKKLGVELDYYSHHDQIRLAAYMFSIGEANHWTAYRAIMNGGTYSFYSRLLDQHFTVHCKL